MEFRYAFGVGEVPEKTVRLALERPGDFRITLNGAAVPAKPDGWFLDKSFETVPLSGLVAGRNELVLACAYRNDMEVEDCFLLGDFAVDSQRAIVREPERLRFGDWCLQGYPHYCGSMVYGFEFDGPEERAVLRLGEYSAVTVEIRLNGRVAGQIPWRAANRVDLGGKIGAGRNFLEIEVVGSPRNLLGPFHLARGKVAFNEWSAFRTEGREQVADHVLHPYGLFGQVILSAD